MITQTIITLAVFYTLIDFIVKAGYQFNSSNFMLKYVLGMNCYDCFSIRVGILVQLFYFFFSGSFEIIPILATYVVINITSRR